MNKFIKEQLKKANVIIKYPDGNIVDLDNITNCEFTIQRIEKINDPLNILGTQTDKFKSNEPNISAKPQQTWPQVIIKRKND